MYHVTQGLAQSRTQSNAYARARKALALGKETTGTPKFWGSGCCEHAQKPNRLNAGSVDCRLQRIIYIW